MASTFDPTTILSNTDIGVSAAAIRTAFTGAKTDVDALHVRLAASGTAFNLLNFANDAAAATGLVPVGGFYHTSGAVKVRLT